MTEWIIAGSAFGALCVSLWNTRKIGELHVIVNSRLTELLAAKDTLTESKVGAARAEGHLAGVVEGAIETKL